MDFTPLWLSLKTALVATVITLFLGVAAARWRLRFRSRTFDVFDGILMFPLALPPTVLGLILLMIFGRNSPVGRVLESIGIHIIFSWPAAVIAAVCVSFPLMYQTIRAAFMQLDPNLIDVARTFGFNEWRILWQIMVPLSWAGVTAGVILSFMRALGEFGPILVFSGATRMRTEVLPTTVFLELSLGDLEAALAVSILMVIVAILVLGVTRMFGMRGAIL